MSGVPDPSGAAGVTGASGSAGSAGVFAGSGVLAGRAVLRLVRNPASVAGAVVFPLLFFGLFDTVMGRVMAARGFDYDQALPATIAVQATFFASMASAWYIADDRLTGISGRFRSLPVGRAAPLVGRTAADVARATVSVLVVLVVGVAAGLRFEAWWGPAVFVAAGAAFALAASLGLGLIGYRAPSPDAAASLASLPYLPLLMLSTGFAPAEDFPDWMEPFVRWQPVSAAVDALRATSGDGALARPLLIHTAWVLALGAVFAALGARSFGRTR